MAKLDDSGEPASGANKLGLGLALAFYVVSVVMVTLNTSDGGLVDRGVKTLTIAHWQLEDGFRQGLDAAIKEYERMKAAQGIKVKITQTTVPFRGYQQWYVTQLISGDPADIIEVIGSSQLQSQYFLPLSNYIAAPNPYNQDTPLAGLPWKDTYIDGMNSALDPVYAEYFGVGTFFHVLRLYVNKSLLAKATGGDAMPKTFDEWMDCCAKLRAYGEKVGEPIIPIGVRGLDKATVNTLFQRTFSQLNGNLNDDFPRFGGATAPNYELFIQMAAGELDRERLLEAVDLTQELGQHFSEGFTSTDLEQTKFLFFTGNVAFFPEGTHDAWSLVNNSPFEVEVIDIPTLGPDNRYYTNFTGRTSEVGVGVGGKFGVTKASENPELALDFLQFLTSYKINQMTMMDHCKWPPAVLKAQYKGLLEKFRPVEGDAQLAATAPFALGAKSSTKMLEALERVIVEKPPRPKEYFWRQFIANLPYLLEEATDAVANGERQLFDIEGQRNCAAVGLLASGLGGKQRRSLESRQAMGLENLVDQSRQDYMVRQGLEALRKLERQENAAAKEVK